MSMKQCLSCGVIQSVECFAVQGGRRRKRCIECQASWNAMSTEEQKALRAIRDQAPTTEKFCAACNTVKPVDQFHKSKRHKHGLASECKDCDARIHRNRREKKKVLPNTDEPSTMLVCAKCHTEQPISQFGVSHDTKTGRQTQCRACLREYRNQFYAKDNNQIKQLVVRLQGRAKKHAIPFDLTVDDIVIPEYCPVLGIPLKFGHDAYNRDNSPSVDRIIPSFGYVKGNIIVVSFRANRIKNDATIQELKTIANFYDQLTNSST